MSASAAATFPDHHTSPLSPAPPLFPASAFFVSIMAPIEQADTTMETFHERSAINSGMSGAATTGFAGLLISAVQNSTQKHGQGALGVFTRSGSTIALFTAMGGIFSFTDSYVANARRKDDALNGAAGGCAAGLVIGAGGEWE